MSKGVFDKNILNRNCLIQIVVLVIIYVLLGNIKEIQSNPFVPGAVIAVNMIVIVLAGILFGRSVGLSVGFAGTAINAIITMSGFEFASIIPHAIMGFTAGYLKERTNIVGSSLAIIVGHFLNILFYIVFGLFLLSELFTSIFWLGIVYETIFGIISISILAYLYKALFKK